MSIKFTPAIIKKTKNKYCPICNNLVEIVEKDTSNVEYIKTKEGNRSFYT